MNSEELLPKEFVVSAIGVVRSPLHSLDEAPRQGSEGAPDVWIDLLPELDTGLKGLEPGASLIVVTWLHAADREVLEVHPRNDTNLPLTGVFATRSPDRPNPIGLHVVTLRSIGTSRIEVGPLEAIDGTPVLDLKPLLPGERAAAR